MIDMIYYKKVYGVYIAISSISSTSTTTTSGTFSVYIGTPNESREETFADASKKCDVQNNVGTNAQGGAFNCQGLYGQYFYIYCEVTC